MYVWLLLLPVIFSHAKTGVLMKVLLLLAAIIFMLGSLVNAPGGHSSTGAPHDVWTSNNFSESDLPCGVPTTHTQFSIDDRRTAENAYMLMAANHLAYRFWPGRRERILRQWGFSNFEFFDNSRTSTNGLWAEHKDFVLLVFRGTQEPTDLVTDANVTLDPPPSEWNIEGRLHRGFLNAAQSVDVQVSTAATLAQAKQKPLVVSGHSLGGALALLSAIHLEKQKTPVHSIWAFGAPKVGDPSAMRSMSKILSGRLHQLNQPTDPIPLLPFTSEEQLVLDRLAQDYGKYLPLFGTLAANAAYNSAGGETQQQQLVTRTSLVDFARGFWKHLPRSYVCDLGQRTLPVE